MSRFVNFNFNFPNSIVIKNGYNTNSFSYNNKHRVKNKVFSIISIGRLHPVKGYDILLEAVSKMNEFKLVIIGEGKFKQEYQDSIMRKGLKDKVEFIGAVKHKDLKNYLSKADLFCLPSRSEGLPATPLEAMACGLPVACTKVGGIPEFIIEGFNGYLCEPEDPESLANVIIKAKNTNWNNKAIADWVKDNFSWEKWADQLMLEFYKCNDEK